MDRFYRPDLHIRRARAGWARRGSGFCARLLALHQPLPNVRRGELRDIAAQQRDLAHQPVAGARAVFEAQRRLQRGVVGQRLWPEAQHAGEAVAVREVDLPAAAA